jgi:hypothetical protein
MKGKIWHLHRDGKVIKMYIKIIYVLLNCLNIRFVAENLEMLFVSACVQPQPEKEPSTLHRRVFAMTGVGRRKEIKT